MKTDHIKIRIEAMRDALQIVDDAPLRPWMGTVREQLTDKIADLERTLRTYERLAKQKQEVVA